MRGRSSEMRMRVLAFSSPTCLFVALIIQIRTWRLVFTREFGNEIERGPETFEGNLDGKNAGGLPSLQGCAEILDERLRGGLIDHYGEFCESTNVPSGDRGGPWTGERPGSVWRRRSWR